MEKQIDPENIKKPSASNFLYPTFSELSKSTAIHGAIMGNLYDSNILPEGRFLYTTPSGIPVHLYTQLITYSRDIIRIYNVEIFYEPTNVPTRVNSDYKLSLTHEIPLFGEIKEISMIRHAEQGNKGYLVVTFSGNKVATLTLDALTNSLDIVDLHNFDNPSQHQLMRGKTQDADESIMKVDRFSRCVAILRYRHMLTLMMTQSFYTSLGVDLTKETSAPPNYTSFNKSGSTEAPFYGMTYYFNLADYNINNPVDFVIVEFSKELRIYILNQLHPVNKDSKTMKHNDCELVGFRLNPKFFTTPIWEKNKIQESPKENLEVFSSCMKFKLLPSDCFKVLSLPRGGFLVFATYAVFFLDIVQAKDESFGFIVNQQYENSEERSKLYYKCNLVNRKPDCQINLRNYRIEILDTRHILLSGVGTYLLKLDLRKEGVVEHMEILKIPELVDHRVSFITIHNKLQKDNIYKLLLGSYMTNAHFVELELFNEPKLELQLTKMARVSDQGVDRGGPQMDELFFKVSVRDTLQTMSPTSDLLAPKICHSNPFHLIASCSYGVDSALLFMKTRVELKANEMLEPSENTRHIISVKTPGGNSNVTQYLLLSRERQTDVLVCENAQLKSQQTLFLLDDETFQSKRLKEPRHNVIIQITPACIRFIDTHAQEFHDVEMTRALDCRLKGNTLCVLTPQRRLEVYTFLIPENESIKNVVFRQREFMESDVSCFALMKRRRVFPERWNPHDVILGAAYQELSVIKLFIIPGQIDQPIQLFFVCPYVNEGIPNLLNILDEGETKVQTLVTRMVTSSSLPNPTNSKIKNSCTFTIDELYIKELHKSILLIVKVSSGEYYFYKSYSNDKGQQYTLSYSIGFQKILYGSPLFKLSTAPKAQKQDININEENKMPIEESNPQQDVPSKTIFKHKYFKEKACLCISSEEMYIWLFWKKDEIFIHTTRKDPSSTFHSLCDFNLPNHDSLFSGLVGRKICLFSGLNDYSLDFENSLPLKKVQLYKTIKDLLAFPFEEPRFLVFSTSQKNFAGKEVFSVNLMEIESQKLINSITTDTASILKIKALTLNINGAMIPLIAVVCFQGKSANSPTYAGKVSLYMVEKNSELNLRHEMHFENFAVTDVFEIKGYLFVCKENMIQWYRISMKEDGKFHDEQISFHFTEKFLIMEALVLPNFLICSDLRRSLSIFYWQPENPIKLTSKGDSFKTLTHYATEFFDSFADNLRVVSADNQKNIALLSFSIGNQKVEKVADFHVGALVTNFRRHRSLHRNHDAFLLSTNEGGLCFVGTFDYGYRNLATLQNMLAVGFPFTAGLQPKAYRLYNTHDFNEKDKPKKNFLDGKLIMFYCHLSYSIQTKIAEKLKETRESLLNQIYNLYSINSIF